MSRNKITDNGNDHEYYTQVLQIVWMLCRTPQDFSLWHVVKMVAHSRDTRECVLSTSDLATMAMMSSGKVTDSRNFLIEVGLLEGELRRDPGYPQPVWHLIIPDLWEDNIKWRKTIHGLRDRINQKKYIIDSYKKSGQLRNLNNQSPRINIKSLHNMKASQYKEPSHCEGPPSQNEGPPSQNETKKNHKKNHKEEPKQKPDFLDSITSLSSPNTTLQEPDDQWLTYRDQAVDSYANITGQLGYNAQERQTRKDSINGFVAEQETWDNDLWEKSIRDSMDWGVKAGNIAKFKEVYMLGGDYKEYLAKEYPKKQRDTHQRKKYTPIRETNQPMPAGPGPTQPKNKTADNRHRRPTNQQRHHP